MTSKDKHRLQLGIVSLFYNDVDGLVIFNDKNQIERDFKSRGFLKNLCVRYKIHVYERYQKNFSYWEKLGVSGILVDISKTKEFRQNGF